MAKATERTGDELMAELNADLRARDPMQIMKRQIMVKALADIRQRVDAQRSSDPQRADMYLQLDEIIRDLSGPDLS